MAKQHGEVGSLREWSVELGEGGGRRAKYEIKLWSHQRLPHMVSFCVLVVGLSG